MGLRRDGGSGDRICAAIADTLCSMRREENRQTNGFAGCVVLHALADNDDV